MKTNRMAGTTAQIEFLALDGTSITLPFLPERSIRDYKIALKSKLGTYYNLCNEASGECFGEDTTNHLYSSLSDAGLVPKKTDDKQTYVVLLKPTLGLGGTSPFKKSSYNSRFTKGATKNNQSDIRTIKLLVTLLEDGAHELEKIHIYQPLRDRQLEHDYLGYELVQHADELEQIAEEGTERVQQQLMVAIDRMIDTSENFILPGGTDSMTGMLGKTSPLKRQQWKATLHDYMRLGHEAHFNEETMDDPIGDDNWRWSSYLRSIKKAL
tara:strand:- start:1054 stop:1857 length:804 start_codon:yes stop_codon:yes gene_type:complete